MTIDFLLFERANKKSAMTEVFGEGDTLSPIVDGQLTTPDMLGIKRKLASIFVRSKARLLKPRLVRTRKSPRRKIVRLIEREIKKSCSFSLLIMTRLFLLNLPCNYSLFISFSNQI